MNKADYLLDHTHGTLRERRNLLSSIFLRLIIFTLFAANAVTDEAMVVWYKYVLYFKFASRNG